MYHIWVVITCIGYLVFIIYLSGVNSLVVPIFWLYRAAVEHEKKVQVINDEYGQAMEKNVFSKAREIEKLRAIVC